jgi:Fur family transcriptional regulator, iron response regulator
MYERATDSRRLEPRLGSAKTAQRERNCCARAGATDGGNDRSLDLVLGLEEWVPILPAFTEAGMADMAEIVGEEEIARRLIAAGVFPTKQRLDVGLVILAKPQHLSADQIIAGIRAMGSRVSKATVYNTLNLFCERGLLRTVEVDPTRHYYDSTIDAHHHFYNVDTGEITDIPLDAISLQVGTALPPGTEQAGVEVVIRVRSR